MNRKRKIIVVGIVLFIAICILLSYTGLKGVSRDYWVWLGRPNPIGMNFIESYPGHDLTAKYRHEDYFTEIPGPNAQYKDFTAIYGEPLEFEKNKSDDSSEYVSIKSMYDDFYIYGGGHVAENTDDYDVYSVIVTDDDLSFTRDEIRVGDSKEKITQSYRYYDKMDKDQLSEGYDEGYIDGSMLTGQTWVEFKYDENDCVELINIIGNPY